MIFKRLSFSGPSCLFLPIQTYISDREENNFLLFSKKVFWLQRQDVCLVPYITFACLGSLKIFDGLLRA